MGFLGWKEGRKERSKARFFAWRGWGKFPVSPWPVCLTEVEVQSGLRTVKWKETTRRGHLHFTSPEGAHAPKLKSGTTALWLTKRQEEKNTTVCVCAPHNLFYCSDCVLCIFIYSNMGVFYWTNDTVSQFVLCVYVYAFLCALLATVSFSSVQKVYKIDVFPLENKCK